jgi:hypothetical protein
MIVLAGITSYGLLGVILGLNAWYFGPSSLPIWGSIFGAAVFVIAPVLGILDLCRGKRSGHYLACLSLLCSASTILRVFSSFLTTDYRPTQLDGGIMMALFSLAFFIGALLISLNTSRTVREYFDGPSNATFSLPTTHEYSIHTATDWADAKELVAGRLV